jgi:hypothetical protein
MAKGRDNRGCTPGEAHHKAKLTGKDVLKIRKLGEYKILKLKTIAILFGVTHASISKIINYKTWSHVQ